MQDVIIVTGAADGIGWATAQRLASDGACITLFDVHEEKVKTRACELGEPHLGIACDVTNENSVKVAIDAVVAHFGQIDGLVNNAGIGDQTGATITQNVDAFDHVLAVHLRGNFLMSRAVASHMLKTKSSRPNERGSIVNLGSIASLTGLPSRNAYSAAKAGIVGMTRAMASEWARAGIRVNAIAPGYVQTNLINELANKGAIDVKGINHRTPMGRMAQPAEIAEAIAFLISPKSSYITGAVIPVDGGWTAFGGVESALDAHA